MLQVVLPGEKNLIKTGLLAFPMGVILLIKDAGLPFVVSALFLIICGVLLSTSWLVALKGGSLFSFLVVVSLVPAQEVSAGDCVVLVAASAAVPVHCDAQASGVKPVALGAV